MTPYLLAKGFLYPIFRVVWRMRAVGAENVPMEGPLIVAGNHVSYMDPPALGVMCPRPIRYMAKEELFRVPLLGPAIRALGAYPVDRSGSATAAIKRSVEVLRAGGAIGVFPEGGRNRRGSAPPREGVALLAALAPAPVLPAYISGTRKTMRLGQITVAFGRPVQLPAGRKATRDDLAKFTQTVMGEIASLSEMLGGNQKG